FGNLFPILDRYSSRYDWSGARTSCEGYTGLSVKCRRCQVQRFNDPVNTSIQPDGTILIWGILKPFLDGLDRSFDGGKWSFGCTGVGILSMSRHIVFSRICSPGDAE